MNFNDLYENFVFSKNEREIRKKYILRKFHYIVSDSTFTDFHYSLYRFAKNKPFEFFDKSTVKKMLTFFDNNRSAFYEGLIRFHKEITSAIFSTLRESESWNKEENLDLNKIANIIEFENLWHPEYIRYCEHIYSNLIKIPLHVLERKKEKNYIEGQTLPNQVNLLKQHNLGEIVNGYNKIIRNAISHGGVNFKLHEIHYIDKYKGKEETVKLSPREFLKIFDSLTNTCHSIIISMILCILQKDNAKEAVKTLPLGLKFLFAEAFTTFKGFKVTSIVESEIAQNKEQLNILMYTDSLSRGMHILQSSIICANLIKFGVQDFDRFGITVDCGKEVPSSIFYNFDNLKKIINENLPVGNLIQAIETSLLWYDNSRIKKSFDKWKIIIHYSKETFKTIFHERLKKEEIFKFTDKFFVKKIENKSTNTKRRLLAYVILKDIQDILKINGDELLAGLIVNIVANLRKNNISLSKDLFGKGFIKRKPIYVWSYLCLENKRMRNILDNNNWLIKIEWIYKPDQFNPIFVKAPDFFSNNYRIKFNPSYFRRNGDIIDIKVKIW